LTLSQQPSPKVKVGVVNVEESKGLKQRYSIQNVPVTILIKNGQEFTRFEGDLQPAAVNQAIEQSAIKNLPH
jgi:thioredoxin-like negative regulator of GroEL